jgi:hypothetical protein
LLIELETFKTAEMSNTHFKVRDGVDFVLRPVGSLRLMPDVLLRKTRWALCLPRAVVYLKYRKGLKEMLHSGDFY